jgi:hypothetical protein
MQMGVTLAALWQTRSLWQSASLRVCLWLDSRSGGWSIARSRAEGLTGQTDLSGTTTVMTLRETIETTRINHVAALIGAATAVGTIRLCRARLTPSRRWA